MSSMSSWLSTVSKQVTDLITIPPQEDDPVETGPETKTEAGTEPTPPVTDSPMTDMQRRASEASHAAAEQAMALGASMYSFAMNPSKVKESLDSMAQSVTSNVQMLGEFDAEQRKWTEQTETRASAAAAVPPWVRYNEETLMKKQILALALDSRNFLRDPPGGTDFGFDMASAFPVGVATLNEDPNLRKMRFQLVPKQLNEERFWRNYFYRVSLIKQSAQLSTLAAEGGSGSTRSASPSSQHTAGAGAGNQPVDDTDDTLAQAHELDDDEHMDQPQVTDQQLDEVRTQLGLATHINKHTEKDKSSAKEEKTEPAAEEETEKEDWEDEILAELNDYELVNEHSNKTDQQWEQEISDLLESEDS